MFAMVHLPSNEPGLDGEYLGRIMFAAVCSVFTAKRRRKANMVQQKKNTDGGSFGLATFPVDAEYARRVRVCILSKHVEQHGKILKFSWKDTSKMLVVRPEQLVCRVQPSEVKWAENANLIVRMSDVGSNALNNCYYDKRKAFLKVWKLRAEQAAVEDTDHEDNLAID